MKIGIVGLGYVGLPLAVAFAEAELRRGRRRRRPGARSRRCARAARTSRTSRTSGWPAVLERCMFTTRFVELHETDAILVCVPTPLTRNREPDLGPLLGAAQALAGVIRRGQTIILESTTFPGTTREHMVPLLEESGLRAGEDFALAFSPERVDPGRTDYTLRNTPKVVGGLHDRVHRGRASPSTRRSATRSCGSRRPRSPSSRSCSRTSSARSTSRWSTRWRCSPTAWGSTSGRSSTPPRPSRTASCASSPGPGMGGHCLPVDPFYLTWKAREYDLSTEFIELAGKVNQQMPYFCLEKAEPGAERRRQVGQGRADPDRRRLLQGRRGRHARVTGAEDPQAAARARRGRRLPRPARARAGRPRPAQRASCRRPPTAWTWRSSSPPTRPSTTARSPSAPSSRSTCAASRAALGAGVAAALAALERVVGGALGVVRAVDQARCAVASSSYSPR